MATILQKGRGLIVIADDDDDIRSEMRDVLEAEGYGVVEARDGLEALEVIQANGAETITALVLDLWMPRLSGWEVLQVMKCDAAISKVPVLVASALSVHGDASGIGATMQWLRKPFGSRELLEAVQSCGARRSTPCAH